MRKTLSKLVLGVIISSLLLLALPQVSSASSINSSVGVQSYMRYENGAIIPMNTSYDFGSATKSWDEGYFTTIHAGTLAITGVVTGTLDLDGNTFILDADGDTSLDAAVDDKVDITFPAGVGQFQIGDGTYSWVGTPVFGVEGDQELTGDLKLNAGGTVSTSANGNLVLLPNGTGYTLVGDAGSTSHTFNTNDDLFAAGRLEVDGIAYLDSDATLAGDLTLTSGATISSTANGNITHLPNGTGYSIFGDAGATSHTLNTNDDVFVTGRLETDGIAYLDSDLQVGGNVTVAGDPTYTAGATFATTSNGNLNLLPNGTGYTKIGDVTTPDKLGTTANDDLYVSGKLETDGNVFFDASLDLATTLTLTAGGQITSTANGNVDITPNGSGYVTIGDAGAGSFGTPTNDDLFVAGRIENDGLFLSDGGIRINNNMFLTLGASNDSRVEYDLASAADTVQWYLPNSSLGIVFTDIDYLNKDHDHALQSNPTIFIHDDTDPDVTNNKWISFSHNGTGGTITTGANTGAGSSPATIDNSILFQPRGTTQMTITGVGGIIYTPTATQNISAAGGIGTTVFARIIRVQGNGGAIDITATLQIAAGTDGQMITLEGRSDTNTLKFDDGNGLQLAGGTSFTMGKGDMMTLIYDSTDAFWYETNRSDN